MVLCTKQNILILCKMQYHYIYKITLLLGKLKGRYYYGKRSKNVKPENDAYAGSGIIVKDYFKKYGKIKGVTYEKEIVELNPDKYTNAEREKWYIGQYLGNPMCLNLTSGGMGGFSTVSPMKGKHHTEEAKEKNRIAHLGKPCPMSGKHHTEISKQKMSKSKIGSIPWNKGIPWSEEAKQKMSETKKGCPGTFKGRHHTEETKQILREQRVGKTLETNPQNVPIIATDTKDGKIYDFKSIGEAARELKLSRTNLVVRLKENPDGVQVKQFYFKYKEIA